MLLRSFCIICSVSALASMPVHAEPAARKQVVALRDVNTQSTKQITHGSSTSSAASKVQSELRTENLNLKEQQQVLIDYTKQLRLKYKNLQNHCLSETKQASQQTSVCTPPDDMIPVAQYLDLQRKFQDLQEQVSNDKFDKQGAAKQIALNSEQNEKLENQLNNSVQEFATYKNEKEKILSEITAKNKDLEAELARQSDLAKDYSEQLESSQKMAARVPSLEKELLSLKSELLLKKSAAEILLPEKKNEKVTPVVPAKVVTPVKKVEPPTTPNDVTIIEVTGNKVSLRVGPGTQHSPIMDVQKGTKLTVEAKEKDWFRVFSPTGGRAFIHTDYVRVVSSTANNKNIKAVGVGSVSPQQRARMAIDPVKPPLPGSAAAAVTGSSLPGKPVRKAGGVGSTDAFTDERAGVEIPVGGNNSEALAIEKLMQAMSGMGSVDQEVEKAGIK